VLEKDLAVQLRDGSTVYVDVFRPVGEEKVPVIVNELPSRSSVLGCVAGDWSLDTP
jgi:predicted acyl esterase